jgi:LPS sulfotransferase NodH
MEPQAALTAGGEKNKRHNQPRIVQDMSNNALSFSSLVKDLVVDDLAWLSDELKQPLPDKRYVIIFTARSGSSWLTNILAATRQLGQPEEYLNPNFIRNVASAVNSTVPEEFLSGLQRRRKTPNGVFGVQAREVDIKLFGEDCFFKTFGGSTIFFNLWRRNLVAQAVSLYRAVETQQYHVREGEKSTTPPAYDAHGIAKWMLHLVMQENANLDMLVQRVRPFVNLCYEDMVADRTETQLLFARLLDVELRRDPMPGAASFTKIGDDWNDEAERLFRAGSAHVVSKIEANRKIKLYTIGRGNGALIRPWTAMKQPSLRLVKSA